MATGVPDIKISKQNVLKIFKNKKEKNKMKTRKKTN